MKRANRNRIWMATGAVMAAMLASGVTSQTSNTQSMAGDKWRLRFTHNGQLPDEGAPGAFDQQGRTAAAVRNAAPGTAEAPTGFDNLTNGFDPQGPPFEHAHRGHRHALRSFNDNRFIFEEVETVADGLGPTYNAQSCRECHQNVVTGGASQVTVQRTGRT